MQALGSLVFPLLEPGRNGVSIDLIDLGDSLDGGALGTQQQPMGTGPSAA